MNITENLSYAFVLFERQLNLIKQIGNIDLKETSYKDTLIISRKVLSTNKIYMERKKPIHNQKDSGWYIGAFDEDGSADPHDYICIYTYQLIDICEKAIDLLQLLIGTLAIIDIVDFNNHKLI